MLASGSRARTSTTRSGSTHSTSQRSSGATDASEACNLFTVMKITTTSARLRYAHLNDVVCAVGGEVGPTGVVVDVAELALGRDSFDASTEEDERTVLETNVNGLVRTMRLCLPLLRDGGHIVNMDSVAGRQSYENAALYVTSKFAGRGFTYALR